MNDTHAQDPEQVKARARAALKAAAAKVVDSTDMPSRDTLLPPKARLALVAVPLVAAGVAGALSDMQTLMIVGVSGIIVSGVAAVVIQMRNAPRLPDARPGTLPWEAQVSLKPLMQTIESLLDQATASPTPEVLHELAFLSHQVDTMLALVKRGGEAPGRGYIGFDAYGSDEDSWR